MLKIGYLDLCIVITKYSEKYNLNLIGQDKQKNEHKHKIVNIFLRISFNICFGCSKEPSHWDGSFEYPQHMFYLRNKDNYF